jgi:Flp pilus assembly protein TadD
VLLGGGLALVISLSARGLWLAHRTSPVQSELSVNNSGDPPDPRRTYSGPYRNIDPNVRYVGDATCVPCHEDISRSYARHPMGRSLVSAAELVDRQCYTPDTNNPFAALGRRFQVDRRRAGVGDSGLPQLWHRQAVLDDNGAPVIELAQEVRWVIGSGRKAYSYLMERDGYLLQTPITWFTQQQRWDLSPGFGPPVLAGRLVSSSCLFCHANRVREHPRHPDRFVPPVFEGHAIGCERCHGPGELHVQGDLDHTIVNPARLSPPLRESVCEQCHLEGEVRILRAGRGVYDYRPGLALADFWGVLIQRQRGNGDAKAVNHVEQMYQSKCFQRPVGGVQMGCITCHDPHVLVGPRGRDAHYRARCLKCHDVASGPPGCSVPASQRRRTSPGDSCIACHMPRYPSSDITHTASTDHRIVRRPTDQPKPALDFDNAHLVDFYQAHSRQSDAQADRTLGLGLVKMVSTGRLRPQGNAERALLLIESALALYPQDVELRQGKVTALSLLGRQAEASTEARSILERRPENWRLLAQVGAAAQAEGQIDLAIDCYRRSVEINPFIADHQVSLIGLLLRTGQVDEARGRCERLLQLDPFNVAGRQALVGFYLREGKKAEARRAFDLLRSLHPPDLARREEWFREQLKEP